MDVDYFCPECGYSTTNADEAICPKCMMPLEVLKLSEEGGDSYPEDAIKDADVDDELGEGMSIKTDDDVKKEANEDL